MCARLDCRDQPLVTWLNVRQRDRFALLYNAAVEMQLAKLPQSHMFAWLESHDLPFETWLDVAAKLHVCTLRKRQLWEGSCRS